MGVKYEFKLFNQRIHGQAIDHLQSDTPIETAMESFLENKISGALC